MAGRVAGLGAGLRTRHVSGLVRYPSTQLTSYTSNLVYKLGLGSSLPRNNFYYKNWRGCGLGSIEII